MERPADKGLSAPRNKMPSLYGRNEEKKLRTDNSVSSASGGSSSRSSSDQVQLLMQQRRVKSTASTLSQSDMDEAYRRLGHRLSLSVLGKDASAVVPRKANLVATPIGAFEPVSPRPTMPSAPGTSDLSSATASTLSTTNTDDHTSGSHATYDRTHKVAKIHLKDHGEHQSSPNQSSILKKITCYARDNYRSLVETSVTPEKAKGKKKRSSPSAQLLQKPDSSSPQVSPQRHALSELALDSAPTKDRARSASTSSKGLLHSVLEGGAVDAVTSSSLQQAQLPIRGRCLTLPSEPVANDGFDNAEGNLIAYQHETLNMVVRNVESKTKEKVEYKILGLLGQGTFAQVFKCLDIQGNRFVALKVVKNRQAYTQQAAVEIDVFRVLSKEKDGSAVNMKGKDRKMVHLLSYCTYQNHLCLVFELLGLNLYEVLKQRQFRGLPLVTVRSLLSQAMDGVKELCQRSIVHCDLKPENILLTDKENRSSKIKVIDFGSACFEGHTAHTYIQSRFYRSPEVLVGLPYDSAIDMWSLGCVAAELYLGLPILPGVHEHDQLRRICEMIGPIPDKMLGEGSKSTKYFVKLMSDSVGKSAPESQDSDIDNSMISSPSPPPTRPSWRIKSQKEYLEGLSDEEIRRKGGLRKLEKQPTNRYFKKTKLADIVMMHGGAKMTEEEKEAVGLFVHFLTGILDPDPWKRWTAFQASQHPFITGSKLHRKKSTKSEGEENTEFDIYWVPPWDPSVCRRRLLHVQKMRERQQALKQTYERARRDQKSVAGNNNASRVTFVAESAALDTKARSAPQHLLSSSVASGSPPRSIDNSAEAEGLTPSRQHFNSAEAEGLTPSRQHFGQNQGSYPVMMNAAPIAGSLGAVPVGVYQTDSSGAPVLSTVSNVSHPAYVTASSLSDIYPHPSAVVPGGMIPMAPPSIHSVSGGLADVNIGHQRPMYLPSGAQSFSGLTPDGVQPYPMEAELGYALQRPGVVPGMGGDMSSTPMMYQQMTGIPEGALSPHQMHPLVHTRPGPPMRSESFSNAPSSRGQSAARRRRNTYSSMNNRTSAAHHGSFVPSVSTSIREDGTGYDLGNDGSMQSHGGPPSLLSQQLAEHSGASQMAPDQPHQMMDHSMQQHQLSASFPHGGYGLSPGMYGAGGPIPPHMSMYYYVAPDGSHVLVTPQQAEMMAIQAANVYGSQGGGQPGAVPMQYATTTMSAPMHPMSHGFVAQQLPSSSFEAGRQQEQQAPGGIPCWSGVVPPQPRHPPPSSSNGKSM